MHRMLPRQFEELVAELFEKEGYKASLTPATRDGGKDILLIQNASLKDLLFYVECKRHQLDNPVGVEIIHRLYGAVEMDKVTAGIVVASSYFTKDAIAARKKVMHRISLVDFDALATRISGIK